MSSRRPPDRLFSEDRRDLGAILRAMDVTRKSHTIEAKSNGEFIDSHGKRFPYCIILQPFPIISWVLPFAGHMGITDSRGVVYDFQGPYTIVRDRPMLGCVTRTVQLDPTLTTAMSSNDNLNDFEIYDQCIAEGVKHYSNRVHILCWDNCNHHVAYTLNILGYDNIKNYGLLRLWVIFAFRSKAIGIEGFISTWLPFIIFLLLIYLLSGFQAVALYIGLLVIVTIFLSISMFGCLKTKDFLVEKVSCC